MFKYITLLALGLLVTKVQAAKSFEVSVVGKDNQPVSDMVVYLTPKFLLAEGVKQDSRSNETIGQRDKKFTPYISVVQKGQSLHFSNQDDITHHIYSISGENRFEFKLKSGEVKQTQYINSAEEIAMGCNIHDWMSGFVLVVDTPFYGKTNDAGSISFTLPQEGDYDLTIWHPQLDVEGNQRTYSLDTESIDASRIYRVVLEKAMLPIPEQKNQEEFEFLEEY